ncbi:MAG: hypothetical protein ABIQ53_13530 [Terracoccus sp.]
MRIRELCPGTGVLVPSQFVGPGYAPRLLEQHPAGMGYLLKNSDVHRRVLAVLTVLTYLRDEHLTRG